MFSTDTWYSSDAILIFLIVCNFALRTQRIMSCKWCFILLRIVLCNSSLVAFVGHLAPHYWLASHMIIGSTYC